MFVSKELLITYFKYFTKFDIFVYFVPKFVIFKYLLILQYIVIQSCVMNLFIIYYFGDINKTYLMLDVRFVSQFLFNIKNCLNNSALFCNKGICYGTEFMVSKYES